MRIKCIFNNHLKLVRTTGYCERGSCNNAWHIGSGEWVRNWNIKLDIFRFSHPNTRVRHILTPSDRCHTSILYTEPPIVLFLTP